MVGKKITYASYVGGVVSPKMYIYVQRGRGSTNQCWASYILHGRPSRVTSTNIFPMFFSILPEIIRKRLKFLMISGGIEKKHREETG